MINLAGYEDIISIYESSEIILYRAVREYDNLPVLIKYPKSEFPSLRTLAGLKNEFSVSQEMANTGVIKAIALHHTDNSLALILEDKGYQPLKHFVDNDLPDMRHKIRIAINIIKSLKKIHSSDYIHRNIRPDSVLVSPDFQEVALTNLQHTSIISDVNSFSPTMHIADHNIAYISPEQSGRVSGDLDRRSDYYSLGVTLYEMFTGRLPFIADDALELIHNHLAVEPMPPHMLNPDVPQYISKVILKLMNKNPGDRYQSGYGIIQDLKTCLKLFKSNDPQDSFSVGKQDISDSFTLSSRLFGRKTEKDILLDSYKKTSLGNGEIVMVCGEPGCGKTSLVRSISKHVFQDRGEFISGKFDQFQRNRPYSAIIQAFQELLKKRLSSPAPVIDAWKKRITDVLRQNTGLITEMIPEIEQLIGKQIQPPELGSAKARNRFNLTFKNFVKVFPSMDKPLVLFLDDLQWADHSSIELIKRLFEDQDSPYLMLICAYRTGQSLDADLRRLLTEIEKMPNSKTITLDKLKLGQVHGFISRTLRTERKRTADLAGLVYTRTGGNPLFVREYLRNLYRSGFIKFNYLKSIWEWDLKKIKEISVDGNIVELMADKIMTQPFEVQEIMKTASCIGSKFDLRLLIEVTDMPEEIVIHFIDIAVQEGLIVSENAVHLTISDSTPPNIPQYLSFMHDRLQHASYSMLTTEEKKDLHLKIGRAMLGIYNDIEIKDMIFEISAQYSFNIKAIAQAEEQELVLNIFIQTAKKAKNSAAFEMAGQYLELASQLIGKNSWINHYQRTLDLYLDWFECDFHLGNTTHSAEIFQNIIKHAANRSDIVRANTIKMLLYFDQGRYHESVKIGLEMLSMYKINIPTSPSKSSIYISLIKTRILLGNKKAEELLKVPDMDSKENQEIMNLLMYTIAPAYMFNKKLVFLMTLKIIRLSLKYGNAPSSAFGYMFYAMFLAAKYFSFDKSKEFSKLAVELNKYFNNPELETKINLLRGSMHDHWHVPLARSINVLEMAFQSGMLYGDNSYARYSAYFTVYYKFLQGYSIAEVYRSAGKFSNFINKSNNNLSSGNLSLALQMCKSLEGKTFTPGHLDDDNFQEVRMLGMARETGSEVVEAWTKISKIITLSYFSYHTKALEYIDQIYESIEQTLFGMYIIPVFHFFSIINMSAVYSDTPAQIQKKYFSRIKKSLMKLEKWERNCPENFKHLYILSKAEFSRLTGNLNGAIFLYEEAIRSSEKIGSHSYSGLACELASKFHFSIGGKRSGLALLSEACQYYRQWGATAKVKRLIDDHRLLQTDTAAPFALTERNQAINSSKSNYSLDISTVVKASQAISGEIVLNRLLDKLMRIVIENAGAQKATLLLTNKNSLELTAHAFVSKHGVTTRVNPTDNRDLYCISIVNYVLRSKDNIVLRDAGSQGPFTIDSYIIRTKPKSILAMPVVNQQLMRGVLYLENNLSPGVFTEDRLEVLNLLCSQAAISIQNARLYSELRDSETQHRTLLESINVGVFRAGADIDGELQKGNRALAEMFGYNNWNEFKSTPMRSLYVDHKIHQAILNELVAGKVIRDMEINMRQRDGTPIWISMTATMHEDNNERENCIEGVLENITEKRKTRELERAKVAADAANKAKSDFLASMSHEIRTPMNAILGMAEMLWESKLSKVQRNYVKLFKNAGENLLLLINDILDLSKIEAGQIDIEKIDFKLEDLFEEIGSIFALRAQSKKIAFCWYIDPDIPQIVTGDPTRLRQVIVNLVGNALKFTDAGTITFDAQLTDTGFLRVLIKDSGVGIPTQKMNTIFDTFSQADSSTTRNFGGTGLGLSICNSMVKSMGGGIYVSSEKGKGSTFAFTVKTDFPVQPKIQQILKGSTILMVDQKTICREFLCQSLTDVGAKIYSAENITQASTYAAEISLAQSDNKILLIGSPSGDDDCFEMLKKLKKNLCSDWKIILIMDSRPQPRATTRAKQLGASFVHRPVHPIAIVEEIKYSRIDFSNLKGADNEDDSNDAHVEKNIPKTKDKKHVLLVEDSEDNRIVINLFLKKTPYQLSYAENGKEGLEKYIAGNYDIILMDIQMPVMDGYEATKAIREYEKENNKIETPILALTANAFQEDAQRCIECGCTAHMAKPVKKKKLLHALEKNLPPISDDEQSPATG